MTCPPTLVVMAAGLGRRYGSDTTQRLKQIEHVGPMNSTLLDYTAYDAKLAGFGKVVFVVREEIENDFHQACGKRISRHMEVAYVHQKTDTGFKRPELVPAGRTKPWGTGQAALAAAPMVDGACSVLNADDFYGRESIARVFELLTTGQNKPDTHYLVAYDVRSTLSEAGPVSRGFCVIDDHGHLKDLVITPGLEASGDGASYQDSEGKTILVAGDAPSSMNLWGFMPSVFPLLAEQLDSFAESLEGDQTLTEELGLPSALLNGVREARATIEVHRAGNRWFGLTHPGDLNLARHEVNELVSSGVYPEVLWP